jgi:hypothetical protein
MLTQSECNLAIPSTLQYTCMFVDSAASNVTHVIEGDTWQ